MAEDLSHCRPGLARRRAVHAVRCANSFEASPTTTHFGHTTSILPHLSLPLFFSGGKSGNERTNVLRYRRLLCSVVVPCLVLYCHALRAGLARGFCVPLSRTAVRSVTRWILQVSERSEAVVRSLLHPLSSRGPAASQLASSRS